VIKTCPTNLPERCARYFRDGNRNEAISRVEVVFARFIDDPDEAVAVSPSVGDLPIDFSDVERGAIAPVAHTAFEAALELEFFLTDAMRLIPMNFRSANSTIFESDASEPLPLSPQTQSVRLAQSTDVVDRAAARDSLGSFYSSKDRERGGQRLAGQFGFGPHIPG
jgi:hypothetical protein